MAEDDKNLSKLSSFTSLLRKGKMHEPTKGNGYDGMEQRFLCPTRQCLRESFSDL